MSPDGVFHKSIAAALAAILTVLAPAGVVRGVFALTDKIIKSDQKSTESLDKLLRSAWLTWHIRRSISYLKEVDYEQLLSQAGFWNLDIWHNKDVAAEHVQNRVRFYCEVHKWAIAESRGMPHLLKSEDDSEVRGKFHVLVGYLGRKVLRRELELAPNPTRLRSGNKWVGDHRRNGFDPIRMHNAGRTKTRTGDDPTIL